MNFVKNTRIKQKKRFLTGRATIALIFIALAVVGLAIAFKRDPVAKPTGRELVSNVLNQVQTVDTAYPNNITDEETEFTALGDVSVSHAFLDACLKTEANPIGLYNTLYDAGLFKKQGASGDIYVVEGAFENPDIPRIDFLTEMEIKPVRSAFSELGAQHLLYEILELSNWLENRLTNAADLVYAAIPEIIWIDYSYVDDCYYSYFVCQDNESSWVLCFYLYPDENREIIDSVEFQLLQIAHAEQEHVDFEISQIRYGWGHSVSALISAIDYKMYGHSRFESRNCVQEYDGVAYSRMIIPNECSCGEICSTLRYSRYTADLPGDKDAGESQDLIEVVSFHMSR